MWLPEPAPAVPAVGGEGCAFSHARNSFSDVAGTSFLLTMIVMGRDGKFCATAAPLKASNVKAARTIFRITCSIKSRKYLPHPEELAKQASRRMGSAGTRGHPSRRGQEAAPPEEEVYSFA